jgi:predicted small integral membrane protein
MTLRTVKILLVLGVGFFYTLVIFNNITDYDSNYQFVRHVLMMDTTFPGNLGMWRSIHSPVVHTIFYASIITWETVTMILCWWGGWRLVESRRENAAAFHKAKNAAIIALTLGMLMWLVAFLSVGAEWFLMWQSRTWNGQDAASRIFVILGIVLLILVQPDAEEEY